MYKKTAESFESAGWAKRPDEVTQEVMSDKAWELVGDGKADSVLKVFAPYENGMNLLDKDRLLLTHPLNRGGRIIPIYANNVDNETKDLAGLEIRPKEGEITGWGFEVGSWIEPERKKDSDEWTTQEMLGVVSKAYEEMNGKPLEAVVIAELLLEAVAKGDLMRTMDPRQVFGVVARQMFPGSDRDELGEKYSPKIKKEVSGLVLRLESGDRTVRVGVSVGNGGYRVNLFENSGDEVKVEKSFRLEYKEIEHDDDFKPVVQGNQVVTF